MDDFNPAFWSVYAFMAIFIVILAWEVTKMIIAVISGKYVRDYRKRKGIKK